MMDRVYDIQERLLAGLSVLAERLPAIVASPRAYPREAMLLAAILALVVVLVSLVAVTASDGLRAREGRRRLGVVKTSRGRWTVYAVAALLPLGVALALALNLVFVDETCDWCHRVSPAVESWRADVHAAVSCYGCHASGGLFGSARAGMQGVGRLVGGTSSAGVSDTRCSECHEELAQGVVEGRVRMRHSDVIEAGLTCVECHPHVGHESMERDVVTIERSMMAVCLGCHDGIGAFSDCEGCHLQRPSDRTDGIAAAATPAPITCSGCHSPQTEVGCIQCHGLELPHPETFFAEHAGLSWNNPGLCMRCHEGAAADPGCGCHGDVNLHGTYTEWFPRHGEQAQLIWPGGCNCHAWSFCGQCHLDSPF